MSRLPDVERDALSPEQAVLFQSISASPRGSQMAFEGPFGIWMHSPKVGDAAQRLGQKVRFESALPPRLSELAILVCAHHWHAPYEWHVHAPIAHRSGVTEKVIEAIGAGRIPLFDAADEAAVYRCATTLLSTSRMSDDLYLDAVKQLGVAGLVDLVALLGYYTLVAFTLNAFEVSAPAPWHPQPSSEMPTEGKSKDLGAAS